MDEDLQYAKITDRFLAFVLDAVPFLVGYHASLYLMIVRFQAVPNTALVWKQVSYVWFLLYFAYQIAGNAASGTLGKRLFGIRVLARDGSPLGFVRSFLRAWGYVLSTPLMNLGFLWSLIDRESRTWHDLLAGSVVVEVEPKSSVAAIGSAALSLVLLALILVSNVWIVLRSPTPQDLEAIRKANEGLKVLAAIQEAHREKNGTYTTSLLDLAKTSGDVVQFREAMSQIFHKDGFVFLLEGEGYIIRARAKDHRRTPVVIKGHPSP